MVTVEERLSRLEGGYEHVATKADVAELKAEIAATRVEIAATRVEIAATRAENAAAIAQVDAKLTAAIADNSKGIAELKTTLKILLWGGGVLGVLVAGVLAAVVRQMLM